MKTQINLSAQLAKHDGSKIILPPVNDGLNEAWRASELANQFSLIAIPARSRDAHLMASWQHGKAADLQTGNIMQSEEHRKAAALHYRAAGF